MTLPELRSLFMQTSILSTAAVVMSLRWGEARWTAYFMEFAALSAGLAMSARIIEKRLMETSAEATPEILRMHFFPEPDEVDQ